MKAFEFNLTQGFVLTTNDTKKWTPEEIERGNQEEGRMVFSDFRLSDNGRSRKLVCTLNGGHPKADEYKRLILAAPKMLEAIEYYLDVLKEARGADWDKNPDHVLDKLLSAYKQAMGGK